MYVSEKALTFADLSKAMQASAGLGQTLSVDTLPSDQGSFDTFDNAIINAAAGAIPVQGGGTVASSGGAPWGLLALVVGGLFIFSAVVGKK